MKDIPSRTYRTVFILVNITIVKVFSGIILIDIFVTVHKVIVRVFWHCTDCHTVPRFSPPSCSTCFRVIDSCYHSCNPVSLLFSLNTKTISSVRQNNKKSFFLTKIIRYAAHIIEQKVNTENICLKCLKSLQRIQFSY